jgi:hypothetical protein
LAETLKKEVEDLAHEILIHPTIRDLLARIDRPQAVVDESTIATAIVSAVTSKARELAATHAALHRVEGEPTTQIKGFATPKPSLVAVSFDVSFPLTNSEPNKSERDHYSDSLRIGGTCSYDPITSSVSDIEIGDYTIFVENQMHGTGFVRYLSFPDMTEYV